MADIDVTDLLIDPDLAEPLVIQRQKETVTDKGRETNTVETFHSFGVVQPKDTAIGGNEVTRGADGMFRAAALIIITPFRLRGPGPGYQPDQVIWQGDPYVVTLVNNFTRYGAGFVYAELSSTDIQDAPPAGSAPT